jgi:hypothetical protein
MAQQQSTQPKPKVQPQPKRHQRVDEQDQSRALLENGQHMGASGDADVAVRALNGRFAGVIFSSLGETDVVLRPRPRQHKLTAAVVEKRTRYLLYGALIDRHVTTQTLALAFCRHIGGQRLAVPAMTIDRLPWLELHVRTYTTDELGDLVAQLPLQWDNLGQAQELAVDPYEQLPDVKLFQDSEEAKTQRSNAKPTRTYHTRDGTVTLAFRAQRPDGRDDGNDLPRETTFVPALELFDWVLSLSA